MTAAQDARHVPLSKVDKLRQDAADAAQVRAFQTHPDVVALRVEKVRSQVDTLMWVGIVLGLAFTMVNVQTFAAAGAGVFTLAWFAAWLLDPMVSLVLIAVLRAEQITARYQVEHLSPWVRRTKVFAFAATYTMNTWRSWETLNAAGIVLHSVPPVLVYCAAEAGPAVRDRLTEAVLRAARLSTQPAASDPDASSVVSAGVPDASRQAAHDTSRAAVMASTVNTTPVAFTDPAPADAVNGAAEPAPARRTPARRSTRKNTRKPTAPRKLRADYLADARAAWTPDVTITPAWVREVTDCSRGMSSQVAADLTAEFAAAAAPIQITTSPAVPTESEAA